MKYILLFTTLFIYLTSESFAKIYSFQSDSLEIQEEEDNFTPEFKRFSRILVKNSFFDNMDEENLNSLLKKDFQEDFLFANEQLQITKIYPNPADLVAFMDYDMLESITAKVTIRNLLGKVIQEYDLNKGVNKIRIPTVNFDPGVYFYTLSINGKSVRGKKLLVK
ncbi:MAG: T9SS type A sorting domain-containing protein [Microscillaceae bacterium]|nr:T9SS type A sorting domain-containing protein [Microscillaceae bacterium]